MLISLGNSCKIRMFIQRDVAPNDYETNMFDWVISNFDSVLYFLENIDKKIIESDFYDSLNVCGPHKIVKHSIIRFETIHDVLIDSPYEIEMQNLICKYERRLQRLKNLILSNSKLQFIHLVDFIHNPDLPNKKIHIPTNEDINKFHILIKKINPNCNYYLHILIPPYRCKYYNTFNKFDFNYDIKNVENLSNENVIVHFLTQDENIDAHTHECRHWSWFRVFEIIKLKM